MSLFASDSSRYKGKTGRTLGRASGDDPVGRTSGDDPVGRTSGDDPVGRTSEGGILEGSVPRLRSSFVSSSKVFSVVGSCELCPVPLWQ